MTCAQSSDDGKGQGDHNARHLHASLVSRTPLPVIRVLKVEREDLKQTRLFRYVAVFVELIILLLGREPGNQNRQEASEDGRHAMEVVNSAGVMDLKLVQKKWLQIVLFPLPMFAKLVTASAMSFFFLDFVVVCSSSLSLDEPLSAPYNLEFL